MTNEPGGLWHDTSTAHGTIQAEFQYGTRTTCVRTTQYEHILIGHVARRGLSWAGLIILGTCA